MLGVSLWVFLRRQTFVCFAPIINDSLSSLTFGLVPDVLRTIATEMSLFVTCVTFHFPYVSTRMPPSPSSLHKSSSGCVWGCVVIDVFRPCKSSSGSPGRCIHGIWVRQLSPQGPSSDSWFWIAIFVGIHSGLCVDVLLLSFYYRFSPLLVGPWLIEFEGF